MKCFLFAAFNLFFSLYCFSQTHKHPSLLDLHGFLQSYQEVNGNVKSFPGVGINFTTGISNHFDWGIEINGSFPQNVSKSIPVNNGKALALETLGFIRTRLLPNKATFHPFVFTGLGATQYGENTYIISPFGVGLQTHYRDLYFLLNAQYRLPLTSQLKESFFISFGIAGIVSKKKRIIVVSKSVSKANIGQQDRDGDGILDSSDVCPDQPGLALHKGCPDSDGDGIMDSDDRCPRIQGIVKYIGCPIPDTDGDGIHDEEDACIQVIGILKYRGCPIPDRDKDGINDEQDKCMDVFGVKENSGCPIIKKEWTAIIEKAAKNIFFETGKYTLLHQSFVALDQIAALLQEHNEFQLSIEGHTDNQGSEASNLTLSQNRANAVYTYLIKKGIAKERLQAIGYGQTQPIADNTTKEGKAINRRVELKISF